MKKIIIPVDFSEHSEYALKTAALLARKFDAKLYVLHMLELSNMLYSSSANDQYEEVTFYLTLAEQKFDKFLDKPYLKGLKITPIVKHFKVFSEVNQIAEEHQADLVVMGSHGSSGFKEFVIGSNAEKVIRNAEIPVLIVKEELSSVDFSKILFLTNFDKEMTNAFLHGRAIAKKFDTQLKLLNVNIPTNQFKSTVELNDAMSKFFENAEWHTDRKKDVICVSDYTVEQGVLNYTKAHKTDLVIIPTHGRKGISHFLSGSIAEDIVNHSQSLIMTIKID